jgi:hypothetical protein
MTDKGKSFVINGVKYDIPGDHIEIASGPASGEVYARLRPPSADFEIVLADSISYRRNWQGGGAPLIRHINDTPTHTFQKFSFPSGVTACHKDTPYANCGLSIKDNAIVWSIIFDRKHVPNSEKIREQASSIIRSYRRADPDSNEKLSTSDFS